MRIFSFAGIPVSLNVYFIGMIVVYAAAGLGPQVTLLFMIVITHELAHLLAARLCGVEVLGIEVFPFGGMARTVGLPAGEPLVEAAIAVAGPLHNFLLYGLGLMLRQCEIVNPDLISFYLDANLSLAFINMLPALPLDGGRALRGYIAQAAGYRRATALLSRVGVVASLSMAGWGIVMLRRGQLVPNAFAFAIFLLIAGRREEGSSGYLPVRALLAKRDLLRKRGMMPVERMIALHTTTVLDVAVRLSPSKQYLISVTDSSGNVMGEVWENRLLDYIFSGRGNDTLGVLLRNGAG
ncbi:MAG: peptidase M50 [Firmicutes bacterium]|nr:peptidase M50 [Bacillota bacterium]